MAGVVVEVHDAQVEEQHRLEAAEEEESWPPGEAGHGEEPTWAGMVGCGSGERPARSWLLALDISRGEKVERLMAESAGHGRTCSRRLVAA